MDGTGDRRGAGAIGASASSGESEGAPSSRRTHPQPLPRREGSLEEERAVPLRRAPQPRSKWTADTERAFLAALRLCGQAKQAAVEIGRSPNSAYTYRKRHPEFARAWDETVAAQQREWIAAHQERLAVRRGDALDDGAGGGRLVPGREVSGGWDARKRGLYLRTLTRTKRVDAACEAAGVTPQAVSALRGRSPRFAAACEKALADAVPPSVIDAALARAVEGWDEPIVHNGQIVGYRKVYSEGLLRDLLKDEQARKAGETAAAGKAKVAEAQQAVVAQAGRSSEAELTEAILRGLALRAAQKREKAERTWERWRLGWVDHALAAPGVDELAEEDEEDWEGED